jgi:hypothetical protein
MTRLSSGGVDRGGSGRMSALEHRTRRRDELLAVVSEKLCAAVTACAGQMNCIERANTQFQRQLLQTIAFDRAGQRRGAATPKHLPRSRARNVARGFVQEYPSACCPDIPAERVSKFQTRHTAGSDRCRCAAEHARARTGLVEVATHDVGSVKVDHNSRSARNSSRYRGVRHGVMRANFFSRDQAAVMSCAWARQRR